MISDVNAILVQSSVLGGPRDTDHSPPGDSFIGPRWMLIGLLVIGVAVSCPWKVHPVQEGRPCDVSLDDTQGPLLHRA